MSREFRNHGSRRVRTPLFWLFAVLATGLLVGGPASPAAAHGELEQLAKNSANSVDTTHPDWMRWLPDSTNLADISLPGTHDSGAQDPTAVFPVSTFVRTQGWDLANQLEAGIRAWDIRIGHREIDGEDVFRVMHGDWTLNYDGERLTFAEVLEISAGFLAENPTETIVMRLGDAGNSHDDSAKRNAVFEAYRDTPDGAYLWQSPTASQDVPTLGDVRGKIVVLRNWGGSLTEYGLSYGDAEEQDNWNDPDYDDKWNDIEAFFEQTEAAAGGDLHFNYSSAAGAYDFGEVLVDGPSDYANEMNPRLLEYLLEGNVSKTGAVMMDYPSSTLVQAIIGHNFRLASRPSRVDSDLQEMIENLAHYVEIQEDDHAGDRHDAMRSIVRHFLPTGTLQGFTLHDDGKDAASRVDDNGLDVRARWVHDYYHALWMSDGRSAVVTQSALQTTVDTAVSGFDGDDKAEARKNAIASAVAKAYPNRRMTVLVKERPAGFRNWKYNYSGTRARSDDDDYLHAAWVYDGPRRPVAEAGGPYTAGQGSTVTLRGGGSYDLDGADLTYCWNTDADSDCESTSENATISRDEQSRVDVSLTVSNGTYSDTDSATVTFTNVAPQVSLDGAGSTQEGRQYSLDLSVTEPGTQDEVWLLVDWGDGGPTQREELGTARSTTLTHTYDDDDPGNTASDRTTIEVRVGDGTDEGRTESLTIDVENVSPEVTLTSTSIDEGGTATIDGTIDDPGDDSFEVAVDWNDAPDGVSVTHYVSLDAGTTDFTIEHKYGDDDPPGTSTDTYRVAVTVTDDDTGRWTGSTTVDVANVAPVVALGPVARSDEGDVAVVQGTITDPSPRDSFTVIADFHDGGGPDDAITLPAGTTDFTLEHTYNDDDPTGTARDDYTVDVTVTDDDTGEWTGTTTVTVDNVAPDVELSSPRIDEAGTAVVQGTITDPSPRDSFTLVADFHDGDGPEPAVNLPAGTTDFTLEHTYNDDDPTGTARDDYTVDVTVTDDDTGGWTGTTTATVDNVAPTASFDSITDSAGNSVGPVPPSDVDVVLQGLDLTVEASFADVGPRDTHEATIEWGDGSTSTGAVTSPATGTHAYSKIGATTIAITITDDDTGSVTVKRDIEVVDAAGAVEDLVDDLQQLLDDPSTTPGTADLIQEALGDLAGHGGALSQLGGEPRNNALVKLRRAAALLDEAGLTTAVSQVVQTAKSVMVVAIDAAEESATRDRQRRAVDEARALIAQGDAAAGPEAVEFYRQSLVAIRPAL